MICLLDRAGNNLDKLKNSEEYKKYHDILYGDLATNVTRAIKNVLRDANMNNLGDSEDMFENWKFV